MSKHGKSTILIFIVFNCMVSFCSFSVFADELTEYTTIMFDDQKKLTRKQELNATCAAISLDEVVNLWGKVKKLKNFDKDNIIKIINYIIVVRAWGHVELFQTKEREIKENDIDLKISYAILNLIYREMRFLYLDRIVTQGMEGLFKAEYNLCGEHVFVITKNIMKLIN